MAKRKQKQAHYDRDNRKAQFMALCLQIEYEGKRPTVSGVCNRAGISVSSHARSIMNELVDAGFLHKLQEVHWNGWKAWVYLANNEQLLAACPDWYKQTAKAIGIQIPLKM